MMMQVLLISAARTLVLGLLTGLGLKLLRPRNHHVEMTAWIVVLFISFTMPLLMQWVQIPMETSLGITFSIPDPGLASILTSAEPNSFAWTPQAFPAALHPRSWLDFIAPLYLAVALVLLARMCVGGFLTWRLARDASPVREPWTAGLDVRTSDRIAMPVALGRSIILPAEYKTWPSSKRQAVLAHELSHVQRRDFLVQLVAALNRTVFWFSPLAWWLEKRLVELGEAASDDAVIEQTGDRTSYAELLLELTRNRRAPSMGVSMARPSTIRGRIDRILAAAPIPAKLTWRKRALIAAALIPFIVLAAGSAGHDAFAAATDASDTPPSQTAPRAPNVKKLDLENTLYLDLKSGRVVIRMHPELAPKHVARIKQLVRQGFYNGLVWHRVVEDFMAQTGDPKGNGTGGSGQTIPAEFNSGSHVRGAVSMARSSDPNSADSQFFVVLGDAPQLDGQYTYWGEVVTGMEFVDQIRKGDPYDHGTVSHPDSVVRIQVAADAVKAHSVWSPTGPRGTAKPVKP